MEPRTQRAVQLALVFWDVSKTPWKIDAGPLGGGAPIRGVTPASVLGGPGVPEAPIARGSATQAEREVGGRWHPGGGMELDVGRGLRVPLSTAMRLPPRGAKIPNTHQPCCGPGSFG